MIEEKLEWAYMPKTANPEFVSINDSLLCINEEIYHKKGLHMTRIFEYPWAVIESDLKPSDVVLDAGGGLSLFPFFLSSRCEKVVNVDISYHKRFAIDMVALREIAKKLGYMNLEIVIEDIKSMHFKDDTFDKVYCISTIEHVPLKQQFEMIDEMYRVLKPNGILILTTDVILQGNQMETFNDIINVTKYLKIDFIYPADLSSTIFLIDDDTYYYVCCMKKRGEMLTD